jgi:hypothetical protein
VSQVCNGQYKRLTVIRGPNDDKMNEQLDIGYAPFILRDKKPANELVDIIC